MKIVKAFKYFEKDKQLLYVLQDRASEVIQQDKLTGTLVLSVHPLDFLSLSENNSNWRSCHALDGDYRAGNLNYMADDVTVVAYIKSNSGDEKLNGFPKSVPWNNKKWRSLLFINEDVCYLGRQYPFAAAGVEDLLEKILHELKLTPEDSQWTTWTRETSDIRPEYIQDGKDTYHYNDLLKSTLYKDISYMGHPNKENPMVIGHSVNCLCCGARKLAGADSFFCWSDATEPESLYSCDCCGATINDLDDVTFFDGEVYCPSCFEQYVIQCKNCGDYIRKDTAHWSKKWQGLVCDLCYDDEVTLDILDQEEE